jgi:lipopolysaccharide biosynthesis protein
MSFTDSFRAFRRNFKAALPYVRRREHRILQRKYAELVDGLGWTALPASRARIRVVKPIEQALAGEVCLFVSYASQPRIKRHVLGHIEHLMRAGIHVVLILNSDHLPESFVIDPHLIERLSGLLIRENVGFDFAAWAHVFTLSENRDRWTRLYLINDSIVGPVNAAHFDRIIERVRTSQADVLGLTENRTPVRHVQSFFLVLNAQALRSPVVERIFERMLSLPTKAQVIDVYETRLTQVLTQQGLRCEALFPPLSDDAHSANDTSFRWAELIRAGFPYVKTSIIDRNTGSAKLAAAVPPEFLRPDA